MRKLLKIAAVVLPLALLGTTAWAAGAAGGSGRTGSGITSGSNSVPLQGGAGGPTLSGQIPVDPPVPVGLRVTLADSGKTVTLPVGGRLVLLLGDGPWRVSVGDPAVLQRQDGPLPLGAAAVFTGAAAGRSEITAVTDYPCRRATPPCGMPDRYFQVTVLVGDAPPEPQPAAPALIQGQVLRAVDGGVLIRTPEQRPACPPGTPCPHHVIAGQTVLVNLDGATCFGAAGEALGRPALAPGQRIVAAGSYAPASLRPGNQPGGVTRVFVAQAVTVVQVPQRPLPPGPADG